MDAGSSVGWERSVRAGELQARGFPYSDDGTGRDPAAALVLQIRTPTGTATEPFAAEDVATIHVARREMAQRVIREAFGSDLYASMRSTLRV